MRSQNPSFGAGLVVVSCTAVIGGLLVALCRAGGQADLVSGNNAAPFELALFWQRVAAVLTTGLALKALLISIGVGFFCGIIAWLFAGLLAMLTRLLFSARMRGLIFWLVVLPLVGNYYLKALSFRLMLSDGGSFVIAVRNFFPSFPSLALSPYTALLFLSVASIPFAFIPFYTTFESIADQEIQVARNLGVRWRCIAGSIIWPRFSTAAFAAFCLPSFFAFGDTLAASVIGGGSPYVVGFWTAQFNTNSQFGEAAVAALVQVAIITIALFVVARQWRKAPITEVTP